MHHLANSHSSLTQVLELVMDELLDGILVINCSSRKVSYFNNKFASMWGIPHHILASNDDQTLLNHVKTKISYPEEFLKPIESLYENDENWQDEIRFKDGRTLLRKSISTPGINTLKSRVWIFKDITNEKSVFIDSLTGCLNRKAWDSLGNEHGEKSNHSIQYCVAVIDLNDFKSINDDFGHEAGDRVLKRLGATLKRLIRNKQDKVFRTGGDEFCILLESTTDISSSIATRLSNELIAAGINAATGVYMSNQEGGIIEAFRKADERMLSRKKTQKHLHNSLIHPSHLVSTRKTKTDEEIEMLANLSVAIKKGELKLAFQPIFNRSNQIAWIEVLCRWKHEEQDIPPNVFIPLSESTGHIHRIWDWALEESIKTVHRWKQNSQYTSISINFSAVQVEYYKNTGFSYPDQIKRICYQYNVSPKCIKIELTETSLLTDLDKAKELFNELSEMGIDICIDDYGTGFSSLSIMQALPIKCIKIDGSFVNGVPHNLSNTAISKGTISMAHELGIEVCAECIENADQIQFLESYGCDYFQGYFKSKPLSAEEMAKCIETHLN